MADGTSRVVPTAPAEAATPAGLNHLVINVRDIEESHRFWTEILGFKQVGVSARRGGKMRFYSGDHGGRMNHHDIALCENPELPAPPADWDMFKTPVAINHIAIAMPDRETWLKQLAFFREKGVKFHRRVNHGMTHSLYISDPNGYGVEVLYAAARGLGVRYPGRARSRRGAADRRRRSLGRQHRLPDLRRRKGACGDLTKLSAAPPLIGEITQFPPAMASARDAAPASSNGVSAV